jgi:hypothetical protein
MQDIVKFNGRKIIAIMIYVKQNTHKPSGNIYKSLQVKVLLEQEPNKPYNYWQTVAVQPIEDCIDEWVWGLRLLAKRLEIDKSKILEIRELIGGAPITVHITYCTKAEVKAFGEAKIDI